MKKIRKISSFTLVELMMAMAIFTVISLIMMRFFSSAQQIWSKTSQRNEIYSNARIAMDLIARDLQCSLYKEVNVAAADLEQGIYPFWFQKINGLNAVAPSYYPVNRFGPSAAPVIPEHYWTCLNFIAPTAVKPLGVKSSICKIRYTFIPSGASNSSSNSLADGNGGRIYSDDWQGWLVRSCTGDRDSTGKVNPQYNFSNLPITAFDPAGGVAAPGDKWRLNAIWIQRASYYGGLGDSNSLTPTAASSSFATWEKVIPNVVELSFECYYYDTAGDMQKFAPMKLDTAAPPLVPANAVESYGTKYPVMVWIQISLLSNTDWFQWRTAVAKNDTSKANTILSQKLRTFSKIVYLDKRNSN